MRLYTAISVSSIKLQSIKCFEGFACFLFLLLNCLSTNRSFAKCHRAKPIYKCGTRPYTTTNVRSIKAESITCLYVAFDDSLDKHNFLAYFLAKAKFHLLGSSKSQSSTIYKLIYCNQCIFTHQNE